MNLKPLALMAKACVLVVMMLNTSAFAMSDLYGNPSELQNLVGKGKWIVVKVWRSDCGICMKTMPETDSARYSIPNTNIIGVSLDGDTNVAKNSLSRFNVHFKNLVSNRSDFNRYLSKSTRKSIKGYPTYMIYSPDGKLKAMQTGDVKPRELRQYISQQGSL